MADAKQREGGAKAPKSSWHAKTEVREKLRCMLACTREDVFPRAYGGRQTARRRGESPEIELACEDGSLEEFYI